MGCEVVPECAAIKGLTSLAGQTFCLKARLLSLRLHYHGRPVAKDLAHALHDLGGVVANADDGIRAQYRGVFQHEVEGVFAGFLAKVGQQGDVAADERLQAGADGAEDRARAHDDPPHHAQAAHDLVAIQFKLGCCHVVGNHAAQLSATSESICLSIFSTRLRTSSRSLRRDTTVARKVSSSFSRSSICARSRLASRSAAAFAARAAFNISIAL